jgi:ParB-like chromosome segregation protein Spo0J
MTQKLLKADGESPLGYASKIELVAIDRIREYEQNPRLHDVANVEKLVRSLKEYGFTVPIFVDENNVIVAGHGRYLAAKQCKLDRVPCIRLSGFTPEQIRAYRLADNRLAEDSQWDKALLKIELGEIFDLRSTDIDALGFTQGELDKILAADFPPSSEGREGETDGKDLEFKAHGDDIPIEHQCPKCGYEWSGTPKRK